MSDENIFKLELSADSTTHLAPPIPVPAIITAMESPCALPGRFRPKLYNKYKMTYNTKQPQSSFDDVTIDVIIEPEADVDIGTVQVEESGETECGEGDITQALIWIKTQLKALKQEDKSLTERFIEIRAKMNALRSNILLSNIVNGNANSASDPSINDSCIGDDATREFRASSLLNEHEYLGEFRCRSVSLLPPRSSVTFQVPQGPHVRRVASGEEFL